MNIKKQIKLYTEDINRDDVLDITRQYFENFTINKGVGYWKGGKENSLIITIISGAGQDIKQAEALAKDIKVINDQEAVLLVVEDVKSSLI